MRHATLASLALHGAGCFRLCGDDARPIVADIVLKGGEVHSGFHTPAKVEDVAIRNGRVVALGSFQVARGENHRRERSHRRGVYRSTYACRRHDHKR